MLNNQKLISICIILILDGIINFSSNLEFIERWSEIRGKLIKFGAAKNDHES